MIDDPGPSAAQRFDALAPDYDQSGVAFFQPVASRLVETLAPQAGERALDIGCGRGAATLPLAQAVVPGGEVTAVDVSPAMVAATRAVVEASGLTHVRAEVGDAAALDVGEGYDVACAALVLFFLPDPLSALTDWVSRVRRDGGRVGVSTFGTLDAASRALDALFDPWVPPGLLDPRTTGTRGPFASDEEMAALMREAGAARVDTVVEPVELVFPDAAAWQRFSLSTGQRAMWQHVPDAERPGLVERAAEILAATGDGAGRLVWQLRFTIGHR